MNNKNYKSPFKKEKPQLIDKYCKCGKQLNEVHYFFGVDECGDCKRIFIINNTKNKPDGN